MRWAYRILSVLGDAKAASRGPAPYARRQARKQVSKHTARWARKVFKV
jgi:hypothetical protein